jgi:transcriptional regulator with XRE-family HTH domain
MYNERVSSCAKRLSAALNIKGMKQSELCQITKIPKSAVSQYVSGAFEPKQDRIYLMAKALNVSEAWLMGYDVPMERQEQKNYPSDKNELSEGEKMWLELYHRVSDETRDVLINMMDSFDKASPETQQILLGMIRGALGSQK